MDSCDVLIVGGGPAGSSCAWGLRESRLDVAVLDQQHFPRNKVCGGWITPGVLSELQIEPAEYGRGRVLQPITAFRMACMGGPAIEEDFGAPVSYGIVRREFDDFLLRRSGARLLLGESLASLERSGDGWIANQRIQARMLVGAGGHFCPVARFTSPKMHREPAVVAQEAEFAMDARQVRECRVRADQPELYFCSDLNGYGWCFRKGDVLNVGLGRIDAHGLPAQVSDFLRYLKSEGRLRFDVPGSLPGHAYLVYGASRRDVAGDARLLIGDAAGLAYPQSGEGIRPAVESGLMAAVTIAAAAGKYSGERLAGYRALLSGRFGNPGDPIAKMGGYLPGSLVARLGRRLFATRWFIREVVLKRWFLRAGCADLDLP